jgi:hypothetical protein
VTIRPQFNSIKAYRSFGFVLREISDLARPGFAGRAVGHPPIRDLTPPANAVFLYDLGKTALNFSTRDATT